MANYTPIQLADLKKELHKLYLFAQALADRDNDGMQIIATQLQNASFSGVGCANYSHDRECEQLELIRKVLVAWDEYQNDYFSHYFLSQYDMELSAVLDWEAEITDSDLERKYFDEREREHDEERLPRLQNDLG